MKSIIRFYMDMIFSKKKTNRLHYTRLVACLVILSMLISLCSSCKDGKTKPLESKGGYDCTFFELPVKDGYGMDFKKILLDGDQFCVVALYTKVDSKNVIQEQITDIYRVDEKGKLVSTLEISGAQVPDAVVGEAYVFLGYSIEDLQAKNSNQSPSSDPLPSLVFLNKTNGDFIRDTHLDFQAKSIVSCSNGFVVEGAGRIEKFSSNGDFENKIAISFSTPVDGNGVFEENGRFFAAEETSEFEFNYYSIDFASGSVEKVISGKDAGMSLARETYGNRYFTSSGEYRIDCTNKQVLTLAKWSDIDIRPEKKMLHQQPWYYALDDEHFAKRYVYGDGTAEILLFSYNPEKKNYAREKIVLGGFGIYDDLPLGWAIYEFNTTNTEYEIEVDDYTGRFLDSGSDARQEQLRLMKYFHDGHTPDIYYGDDFDYEYWGRNGLVADLNPYIQNDSSLSLDDFTEAGRRLMFDQEDHCYQMFSSYRLNGYWMLKRDFDEIDDMSFSGMVQYSQDKELLFNGKDDAIDLMSCVLEHNYMDLFSSGETASGLSVEDLTALIQQAVSTGTYPFEFMPASESDLRDGEALLCFSSIGEFESFENMEKTVGESLVYVGYPSAETTLRIAEPKGLVAVSTSSKNPEICWEFIKYMFSEEVQKTVALNQSIPVRQSVLDMTTKAFLHPEEITDPAMNSLVTGFYRTKSTGLKPAEQWMVDDYIEVINSVDRIYIHDWGIFSIIRDEINSYYAQGRQPEQIADTLYKRIQLYIEENYA